MKLETIYHRGVLCVRAEDSVAVAASQMTSARHGAVAVYRGDTLAGILTERDVLRLVADGTDPATAKVETYMTADPVSVSPELNSGDAARLMLEHGIRHLPVMEGGRLIGMISARDLLIAEAWPHMQVR